MSIQLTSELTMYFIVTYSFVQTELTDLDQLREERAALLDKCSSSETQLQDVTVHILYQCNIHAWMYVHK